MFGLTQDVHAIEVMGHSGYIDSFVCILHNDVDKHTGCTSTSISTHATTADHPHAVYTHALHTHAVYTPTHIVSLVDVCALGYQEMNQLCAASRSSVV